MGTRKRAGKGRHDKKGKGKKDRKKQQTHYDDWDPASSGQESDTPSEPERSDTYKLSKQGRQHSRHENDNDKMTDTSKVTGGQRWMPIFVIVLLVVVVMSATPFLLQHYKQTDSGFMSFLKPFASEQQSGGLSQSETNVEYSFTEKDDSTERDNEASCLKDNKEATQEFHAVDADNSTDGEFQTLMDSAKENLDGSTDTEDVDKDEIETNKRSVDVEEDGMLVSKSSLKDEDPSLPTDSSTTDTQQAVDEDEMDRADTEQISHVGKTQISNNEASESKDAGVVSKDEASLSEKVGGTESTNEFLQSNNTSKDEPLQIEKSEAEESLETSEHSDESVRGDSQEAVEQPAESTREETQEASAKLESPAGIDSSEVELGQAAASARESSQLSDSDKKPDKDFDAAEQTESVASEQNPPILLKDSKHAGDGKFTDNVDTVTLEDGKHATASPPKPKKVYIKANITNSDDNKIRQELDNADELQEKNHVHQAQAKYRAVLARHPNSPRANYGLAQTLCKQAEEQLSNKLLEECIEQYQKVLNLPDVPRVLMLKAGRTCAERQQFRGWGHRAVKVYKILLDAYPDELELWNELGVQYLMIGRNSEAKAAFTQMLHHDPNNPVAKAHMGFIYKTSENNLEKAAPMLLDALSSNDPSVLDGRFYFHLGDALQRLGNITEAYKWYEKGEELGLFRSKFQRSLYNVEHLTARPWWTKEQTGQQQLIKMLEDNWEIIRDEGIANIDKSGLFLPESENLRETGDWKQLTLFQQGRKNVENCKKTPKTCALIEQFPAAATCKRGQVKYSIMQPGVHVWPHCGPTNCRIRMHLGLVVPKDCCRIRVVDDTRTWEEGKVIVFDDSFEHEVWHDGSKFRLVLIVDIWHPELNSRHKASLSPI